MSTSSEYPDPLTAHDCKCLRMAVEIVRRGGEVVNTTSGMPRLFMVAER